MESKTTQIRLRNVIPCIMPNAFDRASGVQYKQETCIDQSAYDVMLSMWSHPKKINFTVAFEAKQTHYVNCSKFRAYPAVVGITTSYCAISQRKPHERTAMQAKQRMTEDASAKECRIESIFLSRAAIRRTWRKFPDMQQRMTLLNNSEWLSHPTKHDKTCKWPRYVTKRCNFSSG